MYPKFASALLTPASSSAFSSAAAVPMELLFAMLSAASAVAVPAAARMASMHTLVMIARFGVVNKVFSFIVLHPFRLLCPYCKAQR